jgi:hypothetical protein
MDETTAWLLDSGEPGVRAQALMHLARRTRDDPIVKAAQRESLVRGSIAGILDGLVVPSDSSGLWMPKYGAPFHRLMALAEMGATCNDERIIEALEACLEVFAKPDGGFGPSDSHLCTTGNMVRAATLFGRADVSRVKRGVEWLLAHQRADGGWNCFPEDEPGSTLDSWEPLAALGTTPSSQRPPEMRRAIERGVAFFLEQHLGVDAGYEPWRRIHFPRHYYYDFLLGLELATSLGDPQDARLKPALDLLLSKRSADGRWALDATHPDVDPEGDPPYKPIYAEMMRTTVRLEVEPPGAPSRWATLAAMRVLQRVGYSDASSGKT